MAEGILRTRYLEFLTRYKDVDLIKVIVGMKGVGKSTLLRQYITQLVQNGVSRDRILYIDMDSIWNDRLKDGKLLYSEVLAHYRSEMLYILIDEVQNIRDWVRVVESLRNDIDCDICITGSNAYMLSSEIATLLTGRSITVTMMPLSLKEICSLYEENDTRSAFLRYMRHGGLPIIRPEQPEETVFRILDELKSDIILKDVCNRKPSTDPIKIRKVIDYLYSEVGNPISVTRISKNLGISATTAGDYLRLITDSMLFIKAERYDLKGREVLSQEPKYYCSDTGMRYSQPISAERDFGKTIENIVFLELIRRGYRVYVGRTGSEDIKSKDAHLEIDFIVIRENGTDYYQVTKSLNDPEVREREFRPLKNLSGRGERYVITYDDVPTTKDCDAVVMNIIDFLLDDGQPADVRRSQDASYNELCSMLKEYLETCRRISGTAVTDDNFNSISDELQSRFFDLQALFKNTGPSEDNLLQNFLPMLKKNNVRMFDSVTACAYAENKGYKPVIGNEIEELAQISEMIETYVAKRNKDVNAS